MNSSDAVAGASFSTRADSTNTMPSWAITSTQKIGRLVAIDAASCGELATDHAVIAVIASPAPIQL
jgi:hypothetical protein